MLNRKRAAIQAFIVCGLRDPVAHRRCRLLEESVVLDRSVRLVDAFLRAVGNAFFPPMSPPSHLPGGGRSPG